MASALPDKVAVRSAAAACAEQAAAPMARARRYVRCMGFLQDG
jgi:hypothetical protein